MSTKILARIIIAAIIVVLLIMIYIFQSDVLQNNKAPTDTPVVQENKKTEAAENDTSTDRLKEMENSISNLEEAVADQKSLIDDLSEANEISETQSPEISDQKILATAHAKGSVFSTTSTAYSTMNMFVNITCPVQCTLWINFYTASKNDSANNVNSYGVFLDGQDQSIYNQAAMPVANGTIPISLNGAIPVNAGTHTVEILTKTTGGTMQTDVSFLQVLAIESS